MLTTKAMKRGGVGGNLTLIFPVIIIGNDIFNHTPGPAMLYEPVLATGLSSVCGRNTLCLALVVRWFCANKQCVYLMFRNIFHLFNCSGDLFMPQFKILFFAIEKFIV